MTRQPQTTEGDLKKILLMSEIHGLIPIRIIECLNNTHAQLEIQVRDNYISRFTKPWVVLRGPRALMTAKKFTDLFLLTLFNNILPKISNICVCAWQCDFTKITTVCPMHSTSL